MELHIIRGVEQKRQPRPRFDVRWGDVIGLGTAQNPLCASGCQLSGREKGKEGIE